MIFPCKSRLRQFWETHFPCETQVVASVAPAWPAWQCLIAWATLLIAALIVLLPNLSYPLIEPDETRYAQIALEMNDSRDWVTPTLDGRAYLDKPPLMYWLTAISFQVFGDHETAARLPSLLAALLTVVVTFSWGSRIVGQRSAWLAALSLVLCGGFVLAGRFVILDSLLTFFTTACMLSGYIAVRGQRHRWAWWMISGIACALGILTKGPVALVLCAPPLVVNGWLRADQSRTRALHWAAFVLPMIAVCVPWYVAVAKLNPQFVDYFFWEHNLKRFTQGSNHEQPFWFYVPVVFAAMFPASLLLPSVGVFLVSWSRRKRSLRSKDLGFLFCGAGWVLAFFSVASCKLPTYILPAIPLVCLMMGVMLHQTVLRPNASDRISHYLRPFPQRATLILVLSSWILVGVEVWIRGEFSIASGMATVMGAAVLALTLAVWNREAAFNRSAWAATAAVATGVLWFGSSVVMPTIATDRSAAVETQRIVQRDSETRIVFFGEKPHAAVLHLPLHRTTYFPTEQANEFASFVANQRDVVVVMGGASFERTRELLSATHALAASPNHSHVYVARPTSEPSIEIAASDDGPTSQYSFFQRRESYLGGGVWFDY
ncbi:phospholipid carrier-dependent glycosyltransferase [Rhodopirellula sp. P2]|uniref:phospholipid carrier-dependent glycosyltransferase n=1 Tax=Rhodopirellula sp. P2 TaxID=2127060 RepID=UPI0023685505|nr:phospholipid carrier-dependent glycosyltransferase [Rhodopirellula sp. P2]WDQ16468.1 glycosyltransferase family 39 protein [Rhodopirellula sp. P2]